MTDQPAPPPAAGHWPRQIKYIIGNEACERFSYYGIRSILAGYITGAVLHGGLGQSADRSTVIIHLFVFFNYFMPLFGAWLSDKLIGRYHTILWLSMVYCLGNGVLAYSDFVGSIQGKMICLAAGLGLIAFGSGGIKPCVSAFMGDQFKPEQSHLLQKAYGAFYWSINLGSFFSFLVIPWIKDRHGYGLAFGVPGVLMAVATLIFWLGTKYYSHVPPSRKTRQAGFFTVLSAALSGSWKTLYRRGWRWWYWVLLPWWVLLLIGSREMGKDFWSAARSRCNEAEIAAAKSVLPILMVFALIPFFFALFDQTNSTWVLQGGKMLPTRLFGLDIGAEQMQSMNPLIVMVLVPLFTLWLYPRIGRLAAPLKRMTAGMFLAALAYVVVAALQRRLEAGAQLSVLWQTLPYLILTAGEVLVSTTGLEFAFREAAPEMKSTIMSYWLVMNGVGDLLVAAITKMFSESGNAAASVSSGRFMLYAGMTFIVAILFGIIASFYRYRDAAAAQGK